ncbi:MAG: phage holin family protein [Symploca sp. SIO2E6]|nr:phage holin family protein [Symploca sp. SIO2E6]
MLNFLLTWVVTAISLVITAKFIPGIEMGSFSDALIAAAVLGLVNAIVKPIIQIMTLPLTILSLGLFLLVVNGICLSLVGYLSPAAFTVSGFWAPFFGAIVLSLVSGFLSRFVPEPTQQT